MRRLLTGYALTFNRRHGRHGQLFQIRYKPILCQEDPYLLELLRYIHLNPIRAGLVEHFSQLSKYRYCGDGFIVGTKRNDWQDVDDVLGFFNKRKKIAHYWAVRELGQTATSLAKRLGLTQAGVSKSVSRGEKVVKEMDLKSLNR